MWGTRAYMEGATEFRQNFHVSFYRIPTIGGGGYFTESGMGGPPGRVPHRATAMRRKTADVGVLRDLLVRYKRFFCGMGVCVPVSWGFRARFSIFRPIAPPPPPHPPTPTTAGLQLPPCSDLLEIGKSKAAFVRLGSASLMHGGAVQ